MVKHLVGKGGQAAVSGVWRTGIAAALCVAIPANSAGATEVPPAGPVDSFVWNLPNGEPTTLDPPSATTPSGAAVVSNLCDKLLAVDENYSLSDSVASYRVVTPTRIVYTIRNDVKFWDGAPLTAEDVAFSLKRSAEPDRASAATFVNVSSIDVTGPSQVTVSFSKPDETFNQSMSTFAGVIMEKKFVEAKGKSVGTPQGGLMCSGPFMLDTWTPGDSIVMTRNDAYWNSARFPHAKKVMFKFVTDTAAYVDSLKSGELDGSYSVNPSVIAALRDTPAGTLSFGLSLASLQIFVANQGGTMGDVRLRDAFQLILERAMIANDIYQSSARPQFTVVTPDLWQTGSEEIYAKAYTRFKKEREFDIKAAKKLVRRSSYAGEPIIMAIPQGQPTMLDVANLIQQKAIEAGLTVTINPLPLSEYNQMFFNAGVRADVDLILGPGLSAIRDPLQITGYIYLQGAFYNFTQFDNQKVSALYDKIRQSYDAGERAKLFVKMQKIYETSSVSIPIVSESEISFLNKRLTGAVPSLAYLNMPSMAFIGSSGK